MNPSCGIHSPAPGNRNNVFKSSRETLEAGGGKKEIRNRKTRNNK